jgi:hypothetical protein
MTIISLKKGTKKRQNLLFQDCKYIIPCLA